MTENKNIFEISYETVQTEAVGMIGRELTECELHITKKCIECGLLTTMDIVYRAAFKEAVRIAKEPAHDLNA